ncbi:MerR family transcriptional regulator [Nocardiopsis sp. NPDC006139]|uniref:MerR family transcriptional regulator n=1 Tax=Nocardiopsis TaxID=2013 RepID=UPI0033A6D2A4
MAWSTRQIAELAGTTVKAVRHYHEIGLLDVPERTANGYKQYGVPHLVRLVRIRRLSDLGIPLSEIAAVEDEPEEAIRALDADLEARIDRLVRVREELAVILRHRASVYAPPGFASVYGDLSERQRSLLAVYSTVFSERYLAEFRELIGDPEEAEREFEELPADADDAVVADLAERLLPAALRARAEGPDPVADSPRGPRRAAQAMAEAAVELYNPAQLRVLERLVGLMAT